MCADVTGRLAGAVSRTWALPIISSSSPTATFVIAAAASAVKTATAVITAAANSAENFFNGDSSELDESWRMYFINISGSSHSRDETPNITSNNKTENLFSNLNESGRGNVGGADGGDGEFEIFKYNGSNIAATATTTHPMMTLSNVTDAEGGGLWGPGGSMYDVANAFRNVDDMMMVMKMCAISIVLGLMILITIIGNVFVIAAIILERNLQNVANYLVASLAVADLFVACLVMPLGAVYEISEGWILGAELCDIWTSCDVLCCTASILHLVAIAADRYWTVTDIDYSNVRTPRRVFCMIFFVWFAALIVSLAPQFGWKDPEYMERIKEQQCMVSQDVGYQIFATCCTFYVPLLVILVLYWKIYKIARKRIQRRRLQQQKTTYITAGGSAGSTTTIAKGLSAKSNTQGQRHKTRRLRICFGKTSEKSTLNSVTFEPVPCQHSVSLANIREETEFSTSNYAGTEMTTASSEVEEVQPRQSPALNEILTVSHQVASATHQQHLIASTISCSLLPTAASYNAQSSLTPTASSLKPSGAGGILRRSNSNPHHKLAKRRQMLEAKRERKAAQTLAIITGVFVVCWLPFFVMALTLSLCKSCKIHPAVASLFLWLGYFNSSLNPIIYTIFNPEFRRAFQRILFGRKNARNCRSGRM